MDSSSLKCYELGELVLSSGLVDLLSSKISKIEGSTYPNRGSGLGIKIYREGKYTVAVFVAPPIRNSASTLVSGSQNENPFHFLCSEKISSFSLHTRAFKLFLSAYKDLSKLKSELLESKKPVIITGAALGGSVASLFTLWLLENVEPGQRRPLCITFGSPLIGDASLQQILENSLRSSCFLHVAEATNIPITAGFKPFGTFLIRFESECICVDDPEAVMELLDRLNQSVLSKADSRLIPRDVISRMEERAAKKKPRFDPFKKLNDMKISMAYIEWYKKISKEKKTGYYDRFKTQNASPDSPVDMNVVKWKKELNGFWDSVVNEAEKKPQSETSVLKRRFLLSGNNYRRLIEPLDIAEYYLSGGKEYQTLGRRPHRYVMLEKWFKEEPIKAVRFERSNLSDLLTFDSCFWAEVEEAMIVISLLKTQEGMGDDVLMEKLEGFEDYVWKMIQKREVSPEIFLDNSSFMKWWKEYKEIKGRDEFISSPSEFTQFMNNGKYENYGK